MEALLAEQFPLPAELGVSAEVANTDQFDPAMHGMFSMTRLVDMHIDEFDG